MIVVLDFFHLNRNMVPQNLVQACFQQVCFLFLYATYRYQQGDNKILTLYISIFLLS